MLLLLQECTVITVEGKDQGQLLMSLTGAFSSAGVLVVSASIQSDDGRILDVFRVQTTDGKKLEETRFDDVRQRIIDLAASSSRSSKPAIYGIVAAAEVERLRPLSASGSGARNEVQSLELTAAEMAQAAADLVSKEREILSLRSAGGTEATVMAAKEEARAEAAALLERRMAAMEAVLAARRTLKAELVAVPEKKAQVGFVGVGLCGCGLVWLRACVGADVCWRGWLRGVSCL